VAAIEDTAVPQFTAALSSGAAAAAASASRRGRWSGHPVELQLLARRRALQPDRRLAISD